MKQDQRIILEADRIALSKMKYKFRAECLNDILQLRTMIKGKYTIELHEYLPDCICTVDTDIEIEELGKIIASIPDSHVMLETLSHEEEYTGIREG